MQKIGYTLIVAALAVAACKKPYPHQPTRCPQPEDCLLTILHTTQGQGSHSEGLPETTAEITRGADNRPIKYRGYTTAWENPTVSTVTYSGNRMILTDSTTGQKSIEVWFNACGQPDSAARYPTGLPNDFPTRTYYKYNSSKKLKGFTTVYNEYTPHTTVKEVQVNRDSHGNVLSLTDGMSVTEWTYDYSAPTAPLQIYYLTPSTPIWATTFILEQFGLIDFRPRHIPKTIRSNMSGYQFSTEQITEVVKSNGRVSSYVVRDGSGGDTHGFYKYTITLTYGCKYNQHPK